MTTLTVLDWAVIGAYFVVLAGVVAWSAMRQKSSADYFLAGRNLGWFVIGASLFASNIGSEHLVGLAGAGAGSGMAMAHYELHAWCLLVLGWVLVPFYSRSGIFTMPEFLERRYNPAARWILSLVSMVAYVFTKVSVTVYAGGTVFRTLLPELRLALGGGMVLDSFWVGALAVVVLTGVYTVLGGLRAVVYTDTMQTFVLILGSVCITTIGLAKLGGWGELRRLCTDAPPLAQVAVGAEAQPGAAGAEGRAGTPATRPAARTTNFFNMWRPWDDPDFPWVGILFGAPIVGLWYWGTDQYIVQRALGARNMRTARRGTIWGAYLKLSPVFLFIVPGMVAYALARKGELTLHKTDEAFPVLVQSLLPAGLRGLVVAGLLAALMSSLSSLFNSCSTLFTVDVYEKLRPRASQRELVRVGRIATAAVVVLGVLWIPLMSRVSESLYVYLQSVQAYLGPPITAAFFLGVFWRRINGRGAVAGLVAGFVLGMGKLVAQVLATTASTRQVLPGFLLAFGQFNFLYFCLVLFAVSVGVIVVVSLATPPPLPARIAGLTYATTAGQDRQAVRASWNRWDVIHTAVVLGVILSVYLYFSG